MNERQLPLFAGTDLAERIENAERTMISEAAEAAARRSPDGRCFAMPLAGGVAAWAGEGSPLNKVAGLGFGGAVDEGELSAIERAYAERGAPVQVELSTAGDPSIGALLTRRGYCLMGFENVLALALEPGREAVIARGGRDPRQPGERVRPLARPRRDRLRLARQPGRRLARGVSARRDRERHARLHGGERLRALDRAARRRPGRRWKPQAARRRRPALRRGDFACAAPARHPELAARGAAGGGGGRPGRRLPW